MTNTKKEPNKLKVVQTEKGKAVSLTTELQQRPVIVDYQVIERLVNALPHVKYDEVKQGVLDKIQKTYSSEELLEVLSDEVAFRSVLQVVSRNKAHDIEGILNPKEKEEVEESLASIILNS